MKTILYLHGFYASGSCVPAEALKESLGGRAEVLAPDLPLHPAAAWDLIHDLCDRARPALLVGNSCGSFYAQLLAPVVGVPALLGNPHFAMSEFLRARIGTHRYKSLRQDRRQEFVIDASLAGEFAEMEKHQFDYVPSYYKDKVWGLFGEQDTLARYEPLFLAHYNRSYHFPGGHTPTAGEVKEWYVPLIEKMLFAFPPADGCRCFLHFGGGEYRFLHAARDSGSGERVVVYQELAGERRCWVRPEKLFFDTVEKDGRRFARFAELDRSKR